MKTNCDIIRDLLPLYAEHITSKATNALVEEHLAECEACRAELEQMEQPVPVRPEAQPDAPLRRIRAALQRRSIRAAIGSVLAALCALAMIFWMGTARIRRQPRQRVRRVRGKPVKNGTHRTGEGRQGGTRVRHQLIGSVQ